MQFARHLKHFLESLLPVIISMNSFAQTSNFGEVSKDELEMSGYTPDASAAAVVLFDVGENKFNQDNFEISFTCHRRIKIFKKIALSAADISITYFNDIDKLYKLRAAVYNLEDGKVVQTLLPKKSFYDEKTTSFSTSRKFSFPNVRAGSVIEYEYTITTPDFTYLPDWTFQKNLPVKYSAFKAEIPGFLEYNLVRTGVLSNLSYKIETKPLYIGGKNVTLTIHKWESKDISR